MSFPNDGPEQRTQTMTGGRVGNCWRCSYRSATGANPFKPHALRAEVCCCLALCSRRLFGCRLVLLTSTPTLDPSCCTPGQLRAAVRRPRRLSGHAQAKCYRHDAPKPSVKDRARRSPAGAARCVLPPSPFSFSATAFLAPPTLSHCALCRCALCRCALCRCSDPMQDGSVAEPCWQQTFTPSILSTSFTRKASPASPSTGPCLSNPLTAPRYPRLHLQPCVRVDEAVSPPRGVQHSVEEDQAREDKTC